MIAKIIAALVLSAFCCGPLAQAAPPAVAFFQNAVFSGVVVAPDGQHALVRMSAPGERRKLMLLNFATMQMMPLAGYKDADIGYALWVNETRVVYSLVNVGPTVVESTAGVVALDISGRGHKGLREAVVGTRSFYANFNSGVFAATPGQELHWEPRQDSNKIFIVQYFPDGKELGQLDTLRNTVKEIRAPKGTSAWMVDDSEKLRLVVTQDGDTKTLRYLEPDGKWRAVTTLTEAAATSIEPELYLDKALYVHSRNGGDKRQLFRYSIERGTYDGPALVTSPDFDLSGHFFTDGKKLLGYHFLGERWETHWFDQSLKAIQQEIDALLGSTKNEISRGARSRTPYVVVRSTSPQVPDQFHVYNSDTKILTRIGTTLPDIDPPQMARSELKRYKARDGLSIPAYLTLPPGAAKRLPLVILVKSESWSRGPDGTFDPEVQFLASRGYAVIQPESRGTAGFGLAHLEAGYKQWGLAMQDDLADAAKWAVAEGIADPKRICIAGAGYGGYAALMGLVKDAALFRCAVSWAGIVDIGMMFEHKGSDWRASPEAIKLRVGDPALDQAQFTAASPLHNAKRITKPVFLAYGARDEMVPASHGRALYNAIKPGNADVQFHLFDEKEQSWSLEKNRTDLWTMIEQFLARHNGAP